MFRNPHASIVLAASTWLLLAQPASAQASTLVADLNSRQTASYRPIGLGEFLPAGGSVYFTAGAESDFGMVPFDLWVSNLSTTTRLRGLKGESVRPRDLTLLGTRVVFSGTTLEHGDELWVTSNTSGSTRLLKDIQPGYSGSAPYGLRVAFGRVFFFCHDAAGNCELWQTDGTSSGTKRVTQLPGNAPRRVFDYVLAGSNFYFRLNFANGESQLWKSDGSAARTLAVSPKLSSPGPMHLAALGNRVFFTASPNRVRVDLWISDGTAPGTKSILPDVQGPLAVFKNKVWFSIYRSGLGQELGSSDGKALQIFDLYSGSASSRPHELSVVGSTLYFAATAPMLGIEPWISDGTQSGTKVLKDLYPGTASSKPRSFVQVGQKLVFRTAASSSSGSLWMSDGSSAGTIALTQGSPAVVSPDLVAHGASVLFYGKTPKARYIEPFVSPLMPLQSKTISSGTKPRPPYSDSSFASIFCDVGDRVLFSAFEQSAMLGSTDASASGSKLFGSIAVDAIPTSFARLGSQYYFSGRAPNESFHSVYVTDGTPSGTRRLFDATTNTIWQNPRSFVRVGGRMLFHAVTPAGYGVYSSPGIGRITKLLAKTKGPSSASSITRLGDAAYYIEAGNLWKTDGYRAPVAVAKTHRFFPWLSSGVVLGEEVVFTTSTTQGSTLWFYDGSNIRSLMLSNARAVRDLTVVRDRLFFTDVQSNLWVSDGTLAGTHVVRSNVVHGAITAAQSRIFFCGGSTNEGLELWVSDGTSGGTRIVVDLRKGPSDSYATPLLSVGERVVFSTNDNGLWISDGTIAGTNRIRSASGRPLQRVPMLKGAESLATVLFRGRVLMGARASDQGFELWSWDPGASSKSIGRSCASPFARNLRIASNAPRLGKIWRIDADGYRPSRPTVTFFGAPSRPHDYGNCSLYLDPSTLGVVTSEANPKARWDWSVAIPRVAALVGVTLAVQSIQVSNAALGFDLSNAVHVTIGN